MATVKSNSDTARHDEVVVTAFVAYLTAHGRPGLKVDSWPDKVKRDGSEIDAIAGELAIEHTSIDAFANQRRDNAWFIKLIDKLDRFPMREKTLYIACANDALRPGQDWIAIRQSLRRWLENEAQELRLSGRHDVPGVPFSLDVWVVEPTPIGAMAFFGRFTGEESDFAARIKALCDRKIAKLARHKEASRTTILPLENNDFSNMNPGKVCDGVRVAYPDGRPAELDQIWYLSSAVKGDLVLRRRVASLLQRVLLPLPRRDSARLRTSSRFAWPRLSDDDFFAAGSVCE